MADYTSDECTIIPECDHKFCSDCFQQYLKNKVIVAEVFHIGCAMDGCKSELDDEFIEKNLKFLDEALIAKFRKFKKMKILSENTNLRWCPKPGCEHYVKRRNQEIKLVCICGEQICFECGNTYHPSKNC